MWFDNLMDDCKQALFITNRHKDIFVPIFIKLGLQVLLVLGVIISLITAGVFTGIRFSHLGDLTDAEMLQTVIQALAPFAVIAVLTYAVYVVLWAFIEVGSLSLYKGAINDLKPSKAIFMNGVKNYMLRVASGKLLIHFLVLILSPLWLVCYLLYAILVGTLTGGWGIVFLSVSIAVLFTTWTIIIIHENNRVMESLKSSFRFGRSHFKTLFTLVLSASMIGQYAITLLGPLGMVLGGWFIGGVVSTYFRIVIYLTYLRNSKPQFEQ